MSLFRIFFHLPKRKERNVYRAIGTIKNAKAILRENRASICLGSCFRATRLDRSISRIRAVCFQFPNRKQRESSANDDEPCRVAISFEQNFLEIRPFYLRSRSREKRGACWAFDKGSRSEENCGEMALTPTRCRGENLSEDTTNEDEAGNAGNFEPLSDSCGESDMEGLDLSLFEPQVDTTSWCDSRIHAGTLHILVHYCGKL